MAIKFEDQKGAADVGEHKPVRVFRGGGKNTAASVAEKDSQPNSRKARKAADDSDPPPPLAADVSAAGVRKTGGRPRIEDRDKTLKATQPWKALGMSERTYYRRKAEGTIK